VKLHQAALPLLHNPVDTMETIYHNYFEVVPLAWTWSSSGLLQGSLTPCSTAGGAGPNKY
jgi:hypothetical protein